MTQTMKQIKQLVFFHAPDKETLDRMLAFLDANDNLVKVQDRLIDALIPVNTGERFDNDSAAQHRDLQLD
jgi:hypothetical protein